MKLYEMHIALLDVEPVVRRTVLIGDDMPLYDIGAVLVGAMGWHGSHLFAFEIDGKRYDIRFDNGLDLDDSVDMTGIIARDVFAPGVKAKFQYDFGDDWWHELEILAHRKVETGDKPPRCADGANACPPDDCGGPYGFENLKEASADPAHPDHDEAREFLEGFDPAAFDGKAANRNLKRVLKAYLA